MDHLLGSKLAARHGSCKFSSLMAHGSGDLAVLHVFNFFIGTSKRKKTFFIGQWAQEAMS
jgi:hypothetical protein